MSLSAGRIARGIGRALLWTALVIFVLVALGVLYLIVFPPFRIPETGTVEGNLSREVTLRPDSPAAVLELDVRHDARIFQGASSSQSSPTSLALTSGVVNGADVPFTVRLYPRDGEPLTGLSPAPDHRSTTWSVDCGGIACTRQYLLVVSADAVASEVSVGLEVRARLRLPNHVEVPFLASIAIDAREAPAGASGTAFRTAEVAGALSVSPDAPAAWQSVSLPAPDRRTVPGVSLEVNATRTGEMVPVGLRSPPPVRVMLVTEGGEVVLDLGVRSGGLVGAVLPALEGGHRLVIIWQDRADQAYEVSWRLEWGAVAATPPPPIAIGDMELAPSVAETTSTGQASLTVNGSPPHLDFGIGVDLGDTAPPHVPPLAGVVRLQLELDADAAGPVTLVLRPDRTDVREEVSVALRPGEPVDLTLEALGLCVYRCTPWLGEIPLQPGPGLPRPGDEVLIHWNVSVELWDLDPGAEPPRGYFNELPPWGE